MSASRYRLQSGSKTDQVDQALEATHGPFGIAGLERACPNVSRNLIRQVMNNWRDQGRLVNFGRGRDARWRKAAPSDPEQGSHECTKECTTIELLPVQNTVG